MVSFVHVLQRVCKLSVDARENLGDKWYEIFTMLYAPKRVWPASPEIGGYFGNSRSFWHKYRQTFFARAFNARDTPVGLRVRVRVLVSTQHWEHLRLLHFPRLMVHIDSKTTCLLAPVMTPYVPHIESAIFELPIPERTDCASTKKLIERKNQYRSKLRFGHALFRMLVKKMQILNTCG